MKDRNRRMNGFQGIASVIYILGFFIPLPFFGSQEYSKLFTISIIIGNTIIFYFMYTLGEIIKQLRISN